MREWTKLLHSDNAFLGGAHILYIIYIRTQDFLHWYMDPKRVYYKAKKSPVQQQTFGSLEWRSYTVLHGEEMEGGDDETSL